MNWRAIFLSGVLAAGLTHSIVPSASADPPPWAGVWRHNEHYDDDDCDDRGGYHRQRRWGRGEIEGRCGQIIDRINFNRGKIAQITPTGRHRRALQWYKDDIRNAQRDLYRCRNQVAYGSRPSYDESSYDPYPGRGSYDPYYDRGGSFEWKRDWPLLLGTLINPQQ